MYHVHVRFMHLFHLAHARIMLRGHAVFWRHAQTVALATIMSEKNLPSLSAWHALMIACFTCVLPAHWARPRGVSGKCSRFPRVWDVTPPLLAGNLWDQ